VHSSFAPSANERRIQLRTAPGQGCGFIAPQLTPRSQLAVHRIDAGRHHLPLVEGRLRGGGAHGPPGDYELDPRETIALVQTDQALGSCAPGRARPGGRILVAATERGGALMRRAVDSRPRTLAPAAPAIRSSAASSPARYVARIDRATGGEIPGPIHPAELLVGAHRARGPVGIGAEVLASRLVGLTGSEWVARQSLRGLRLLGDGVAGAVGVLTHDRTLENATRQLLGVLHRDCFFRFRDPAPPSEDQRKARLRALRDEARAALAARGADPRLRILITGATGFLGKEILAQAAEDPRLEEVVCLVRVRAERDPRTGRRRVQGAGRRGAELLRRLGIGGQAARKFRFVRGDVERPRLGLAPAERRRLLHTLSHVVHCAARVSFEDDYESAFRANVVGSRQALRLSLDAQRTRGTPFVAHVAIETSYVHGRRGKRPAREGELEFPRHYYNNFYELTKAMATLEAERALWQRGLRVVQLLPSIVIGNARTGANRGDTKVVNAPINAFGRAGAALGRLPAGLGGRLRARLLGVLATVFPADASAELNLVPVDRVAAGVLAALVAPEAIGERIHLATDDRLRASDMARVIEEELGLRVRMADPTLTRTLALPLVRSLMTWLGEERLGRSLERLGAIFGAYSEWGQPVHAVGQDVRSLALPARRPPTLLSFRMLCRYDRYVLEHGWVREPDEIARRDRLWAAAVDAIEYGTGRAAASFPPKEFRSLLAAEIDLAGFRMRSPAAPEKVA
jgi:nucleoside-diphosphate-sugar epimerase